MNEYELKKYLTENKLFQLDRIMYKYRKNQNVTNDIFDVLEIILNKYSIKAECERLEDKKSRLVNIVEELEKEKKISRNRNQYIKKTNSIPVRKTYQTA
jgi:DNA-binding MarR family transcriptional regulator